MRRCAASVAMASELASTPPTISPMAHHLHGAHSFIQTVLWIRIADRTRIQWVPGSLDPDPDLGALFRIRIWVRVVPLILLSWIRIRIRISNADLDPDLGAKIFTKIIK